MKQTVQYKGVAIRRETAPCCNHCRFCSVGPKNFDNIPFNRYERIVERFLIWKEKSALGDFKVAPTQMYTLATMPFKQLVRRFELCKRGGYDLLPLQINGLIFMPEDELRDLLSRKEGSGLFED